MRIPRAITQRNRTKTPLSLTRQTSSATSLLIFCPSPPEAAHFTHVHAAALHQVERTTRSAGDASVHGSKRRFERITTGSTLDGASGTIGRRCRRPPPPLAVSSCFSWTPHTQQLGGVPLGAAGSASRPPRTFISEQTIWSQTEAISVALTLNIL